ncbi:Scr1 family TA system antitoxin-like transcriptional regulator [Streptomyces sp. NPDC046385]|uniref:Scr1 family TA system antitoxin-like transcriptional regulator n=1 Tax=Streptomyces sp. NPDC046385 TaxID=3154918 RepID=UPI0033D89293
MPVPRLDAGQGNRTWTLLITEAALARSTAAVTAAQLAHLIRLADVPSVAIRIVPASQAPAAGRRIPYIAEYTLAYNARSVHTHPYQYYALTGPGRQLEHHLDQARLGAESVLYSRQFLDAARQRAERAARNSN